MVGDDRIVALFVGLDPLIEARPAHQAAASDSDGGQGLSCAHMTVDEVMDMRF